MTSFKPALSGLIAACAIFLAPTPLVRATTVIPPAFGGLVGQSDYIVRAVVKSVSSEMVTDSYGRHIFTNVEVEVKQVVAGSPPQPLVLRMLGGRVGTEEMTVQGAPKFAVGDEDILFIHGNGVQFTPLVALMHGRYPILQDSAGRSYVARSNGQPLYSESEVSLPMETAIPVKAATARAQPLTPEEFISRIQNAVNQTTKAKLEN